MSETLDLGSLGNFDFTPDWAKKEAGVHVGKIRPEREDREQGRGNREPGRGNREPGGRPFGDRKPFPKKPFGDRKPFDRKPRFAERPKPLDAEIKILPEPKALGTIIRKLQGDTHAYKLKDLAYFFLDNPSSVLLKVSPKAKQGGEGPAAGDAGRETFYQCKACGFASTDRNEVVQHVVAAHLGDYYDAKEVDCEPPKGNFSCVAKCGLSGVLLGPPNLHAFNATVREMIRTRYPDMSEEQYRSHIEMVRDAEAVEEWRKTATRKTIFVAKGQADAEGAQTLTREQAEGAFKVAILPSLIDEPKNLMITAELALKSPVKPLVWAAKDALEQERRAPYNMCFALRGAFHHRKLNFFRANDSHGPEFVSGVAYKEFDAAHAIPELAAAAKFVIEHPCCDKSEFPAEPDFEKHLNWLVTTGHVVAFTNGVFSTVEKFPKYGPQWKKRGKKVEEQVESVEKVESAEKVESVESGVKDHSDITGETDHAPKAISPEDLLPAPAESAPVPPKDANDPKDPFLEVKDETAPVVAE